MPLTEEGSDWLLVEGCDGVEPSPAEVRSRSAKGGGALRVEISGGGAGVC